MNDTEITLKSWQNALRFEHLSSKIVGNVRILKSFKMIQDKVYHKMKSVFIAISFMVIGTFCMLGCESNSKTAENGGEAAHDHDHDHDHDHGDEGEEAPAHGINNGHPFKFDPAEYSGEWLHYNDNDIIRVYIVDAEGKANVAVKADSVSVKRTDDTMFTLDPENPGDDGTAAVYSLDDKDLTIAMNLGVTIEMVIGDKTYMAKIPAHKPHKH